MNLPFIIGTGFVVYALTFLFASSKAGSILRDPLGELLDEWFSKDRYVFEECRMCVGVWITMGLFLSLLPTQGVSLLDFPEWVAAYGLSYFLATQER